MNVLYSKLAPLIGASFFSKFLEGIKMIRFAIMTDIQYADLDDWQQRAYRNSLSKFLLATGEIARNNVSFVLQLGDASQEGWENHSAMLELFKVTEKNGISWRHVLGNHDFLVPNEKKSLLFTNFNLPPKGYYRFQLKDSQDVNNKWQIIVLNGNEISFYSAKSSEEIETAQKEREKWRLSNGSLPKSWNGSVSTQQLEWLETQLKIAEANRENVIICSHFPLYAKADSIKRFKNILGSLLDIDVYYSRLGISTWNGDEILAIMDKYSCIKGYFAGHLHEGSFGIRNNVAHVTFKGIVENIPNAYSFVELTPKSIIIKGCEAQTSYQFNFEH